MVMAIASRELGHDDPNHEQAHRGLDLGPVCDGDLASIGAPQSSTTSRNRLSARQSIR
jgi:hypothetical protein